MKKRIFILMAIIVTSSMILDAQQALFGGGKEITSPEINKDNTVTFRLVAPNAKEVKLTGDWMPAEKNWTPGSVLMTKDEKGIWSYTTPVMNSDLYGYNILVDGLKTTDPNNVHLNRDVVSIFNIFIEMRFADNSINTRFVRFVECHLWSRVLIILDPQTHPFIIDFILSE